MEQLNLRQKKIYQLARGSGTVSVDELARDFALTPQTVRRDLNRICQLGYLQRTHGGAACDSGVVNLAYEHRRGQAAEDKRRIGACTASFIPDSSSLIINIGTTTEQVAYALHKHQNLLVITNSLNVAYILSQYANIDLVVASGTVRHSDMGIVGEATTSFIAQFRPDFAVIGASAIASNGDILDYDYREVAVTRQIISQARQVILVADAMKFERRAPVRVANIAEVDYFVSNDILPKQVAAICQESKVDVRLASSD